MKLKKLLTATLAATMVLSSAMTVCAKYEPAKEPEPTPPEWADSVVTSNATVQVGGTDVQTSVAGAYAAESIQGAAVTAALEDVKVALGLEEGQKPAIVIYDTDAKTSPNAMACVDAAISAMSADAEMVSSLYIDLGAKDKDGTWVELPDGKVALKAGLPKDADTTKKYSVICVQEGGVVTILEDKDSNPDTVTFDVQSGIATYAIVAE